MVLVSIRPFHPRRVLILAAAFFALPIANCFASALLFSAKSTEWKTPSELAHEPTGDCKGKAVALYQRMRENGARDLRLVIGRRAPTSRSTHTWVEWTTESATYILDPTINWTAQRGNEIADNLYVPYYAYTGSRRYRGAAATSLYAGL
jgi:predicted transglutaminase-like cysteine proteinase